MIIKKRDLQEVPALFQLLIHPDVYPYVRQQAKTSDEFYFMTKQTIEAEANGELISRTILDEYCHPIGTISLYDINHRSGFLATWIGQPYFGKGYNHMAKQLFFDELFYEYNIETVFIKIRQSNIRSLKAMAKIPYVSPAQTLFPEIYEQINARENLYNLYAILRNNYISHTHFSKKTISKNHITVTNGVS